MYRGIKLPRFETTTNRPAPKHNSVRSPKQQVPVGGSNKPKKQSVPSVSSVFEDILRRKDRQKTEHVEKQSALKVDPQIEENLDQSPEEDSPVKILKSTSPAEQPTADKPLFTEPATTKPSSNHKDRIGSPPSRQALSPNQTDRLRDGESRRRLLDIERESQRKSEIIKEMQRAHEHQQIDFENEVKRLTAEKKRVQESLVRKTIQLETLRREVESFEQEKLKCKLEATKECEMQINRLQELNDKLQDELAAVKCEHTVAKEELKRLSDVCRDREYAEIELTSNELKMLDKLASLSRTVEVYAKEIKQLNSTCQRQLEQKDKQLEELTRELYQLKKINNLSHNGNFSKSAAEHELKKTFVRFQASQTLTNQLRSTNSELLKKSKSSELKTNELEKRVQALALKQNSFESENKRLKQQMLDMENNHIAEIQRKQEETAAMRRTINELTQRFERYVQQQQQSQPNESTVRERHLTDMVSRYRSELDLMTLRLHATENELKRLRMHPIDSAESETVDRERSIRHLIEKDISSLVKEDD